MEVVDYGPLFHQSREFFVFGLQGILRFPVDGFRFPAKDTLFILSLFPLSLFVFLSISFSDNFVFDNLCCHGNLRHKPEGVRSYLGGMSWKHSMV